MRSLSENPPPRFRQRLDRLLGDLNVLLAAFAIGLACLDLVVLATTTLSDEILRQHHDRGFVAVFNSPSGSSALAAPIRSAP